MAATIFVWRPLGGNVGHAAMSVDGGTYISWWPSGDEFDSPAVSSSMRLDKNSEAPRIAGAPVRPRNPDYASAPIRGLDEERIAAWWTDMSGRRPGDTTRSRHEPMPAVGRFRLFEGANCSNMVVRALVVGGVTQISTLAAVIIANNRPMTPLTVIDIAEALTGDTSTRIASTLRSANPLVSLLRTAVQYGPHVPVGAVKRAMKHSVSGTSRP